MAADKGKDGKEGEKKSRTDMVGAFLKENLTKGELALKHAIGLGAVPNAVPEAQPTTDEAPRPVEVGWHPVGGLAGKWFADRTGLGKLITEKINKYPDPTQHWAVLVGEYAHQLWMDENFDVIYTNQKIERAEWKTFTVGETRFNDDATRRAGESVISTIRERTPAYNLITNNCQTYALQLLDAIHSGSKKEFGTTLAVYERMKGPGAVMDLFKDAPEGGESQTSVSLAQQVMDEHTTQLDTQHTDAEDKERGGDDDDDEDSEKKGKRSFIKRLFKKD